jgi:hypothetical protein
MTSRTLLRVSATYAALAIALSCHDSTAPQPRDFSIVVRFFGAPMTAQQQAAFTSAAARLSKIITTDIIDARTAQDEDLSVDCADTSGTPVAGLPTLHSELIDDIVIYASVQDIDGPNKVLAQAGPCIYRPVSSGGADTLWMPAVGIMEFDQADIASITGSGTFDEIVTHEMMHVLGFGVLWDVDTPNTLASKGTTDPRYVGVNGIKGCRDVGGTTTCATTVPVEGNGVPGTTDSHWRESTFDKELMTGYIDPSPNPLSLMSVLSLRDLGYTVDSTKADPYTIPGGSLRASSRASAGQAQTTMGPWERGLGMKHMMVLDANGQTHPGRRFR